jgi:hypothetical protein
MKKKVLVGLVLLTIIGVSAVFAQSINGLWRTAVGNVISIYDGKAVMTETNDRDWKEAERRGNIGIGAQTFRSIRSTGNLTWTAQVLTVDRTYAVSWGENVTFTMNPDGRTMQMRTQGSATGGGTWTRIQ